MFCAQRAPTIVGMTERTHSAPVRTRRPALRVAALAALASAAVAAAPPPASGSAATSTPPGAANGTWIDADPLTIIGVTPLGARALVDATGRSQWNGRLTGTTSFTLRAVLSADGSGAGVIDETFDGSVVGVGTGKLRFAEGFVLSPDGSINISAASVSGAGGLASAHAVLRFTGRTDASGVGGGQYTGVVTR
jgi:hypothetical protein